MSNPMLDYYQPLCFSGCLLGGSDMADPPDPPNGCFVIWQTMTSDADGEPGDVLIKATHGGQTKTAILINFSGA